MIKGFEQKITEQYEKIRENEKKALKNRKEEIAKKLPKIIAIDNQIQKLSLSLPLSILRGISENELNLIKEKITILRQEKYELLVSNGYNMNYLTLHYQCEKCKDTGYIGNTKCSCYKSKLITLYYEAFELQTSLRNCNFKKFNMNLFSNEFDKHHKLSQRKNMEQICNKITKRYIPNFSNHNANLLLCGPSGTGKTFLSWCIAKELLDRGYLVIYKTSAEIMSDLRNIVIENNSTLKDLLINCDLLIIDDLGAEQVTDFTNTELFNLINTKLLKNKKMLISTNLTLHQISKLYSDRLYSRLAGNFRNFTFYGDDLRIKENTNHEN